VGRGKEDVRAVGAHAVVVDAGGGRRGEVKGFGGGPEVQVEVVTGVAAGVLGDLGRDQGARAVGGEVELFAEAGSDHRAVGQGGDDLGGVVGEISLVDSGETAFASRLELLGGAEDKVGSVGRESP